MHIHTHTHRDTAACLLNVSPCRYSSLGLLFRHPSLTSRYFANTCRHIDKSVVLAFRVCQGPFGSSAVHRRWCWRGVLSRDVEADLVTGHPLPEHLLQPGFSESQGDPTQPWEQHSLFGKSSRTWANAEEERVPQQEAGLPMARHLPSWRQERL